MATTVQKITLSPSRDIPFNKLLLSQSNVRRVKAGVSVEELADDIGRRGLLQGLSVRAVVDQDGVETGMFEIPAGGRRYRALELLVKQKRLAKTAPVPCIVRDSGIAEEDSLAENVQRAPLHPLDQFRAFLALREKGQLALDPKSRRSKKPRRRAGLSVACLCGGVSFSLSLSGQAHCAVRGHLHVTLLFGYPLGLFLPNGNPVVDGDMSNTRARARSARAAGRTLAPGVSQL